MACRCTTRPGCSLVKRGRSSWCIKVRAPPRASTSSPRTLLPSLGAFSPASRPTTLAVRSARCSISTGWVTFGMERVRGMLSAAACCSSAFFSRPISVASPCTNTTCGGCSSSRNSLV